MTEAEGDRSGKSAEAYRTIGEVSDMLGVAQHVLRFWESRFSQIRPVKRAGNRRYYRPDDIALIRRIRELLHEEGYSIRGVQKLLKTSGIKGVLEGGRSQSAVAAPPSATSHAVATVADRASDREELRQLLGELREIRNMLR